MSIQKITSRYDSHTLYECEAESLLEAVQNAVRTRVNLYGADLYRANLTGANLTGANLTGANLTGADLTGASLTRASLTGANLTGANLTGANLTGASLTRASLTGANLTGANLTRANLYGADLTGANLYGANLTRANLYGADLTRASLTGANLTCQKIVRVLQFAGIGSEKRFTVAFVLEKEIHINCGCFHGTIDGFVKQIEKTHANNKQFLEEYRASVQWILACAEASRAASKEVA